MTSLNDLYEPRESTFDPQRRDTVLDLLDLVEKRIKPEDFFEENFITEGMKTLLEHVFRRLEGKSDQGIFKLKQAMGGGKTHNLLALGLLARHPDYRERVMGSFYRPDPKLGPVKVIGFSGRESDAPLGVWGALAEQLGKKDHVKDCYSPLHRGYLGSHGLGREGASQEDHRCRPNPASHEDPLHRRTKNKLGVLPRSAGQDSEAGRAKSGLVEERDSEILRGLRTLAKDALTLLAPCLILEMARS